MKKLLVVFPTIFEADCIFKNFAQFEKCKVGATCEFELGGKSCRVLVSGIGCEKSAERVAEQIKEFRPDEVLLCGFAGACRKEIKGGEFFFQTDSPETQKKLSELGIAEKKIAFSEHVAERKAKTQLAESGYWAVEMESRLFAQAARESAPESPNFTHLRCISDTIEADIPAEIVEKSMNRQTGELEVRPLDSIRAIIKTPKLLPTFIKFAVTAGKAQKHYNKQLPNILKALYKLLPPAALRQKKKFFKKNIDNSPPKYEAYNFKIQ